VNAPFRLAESLTGSKILDEIVAVIGVDATIALAGAFGGQRIYIRAQCDPNSRLARAVGIEAAQRLCDDFHQTDLAIPLTLKRELQVRLAAARGLTNGAIADEVGCHERTVQRILSRPASSLARHSVPRQADLFDD